VGGHRIISGLVPANTVPEEILTDHPDRYRAMIVESANPAHSLAGSARWREALDALEFVVVIDVAMTETARRAHYVLPTASQYEKAEATLFTLEFPRNVFQLRRPLLEPLAGTLPEPEIHSRLLQALGVISEEDLAPLRAAAAAGRAPFAEAYFAAVAANPALGTAGAVVLYETLGRTLGEGMAPAALLWGLAHQCAQRYPDSVRRAGITGEGLELGENLFDAILASPSGLTFTVDEPEVSWARLGHPDGKVHLVVDELVADLEALASTGPGEHTDEEYPVVLSAGERRSSTANTIVRDPGFRRDEVAGALRVSPDDATRYGLEPGGKARITTRGGSAVAEVEVSDTMQAGHVSLPNGFGLVYPSGEGTTVTGVSPNELTDLGHRDWLAGTPFHKHVPARIEPVPA
jgi:anaerobic selenocysteine-containing dehydrogenase